MIEIHEGRGEDEGPFGNDATSLVTRHNRSEAYFWIKRGEQSLTVNHVTWGAEGFFCQFSDWKRSEFVEAIGRGTTHGLALTYDGGGNPWVIDRGCVIDRATTIAVVEHFMKFGGRSDAVDWGSGIVAGAEHERGWVVKAVGEPSGPHGWLPGGYRAELGDAPPEPELPTTATWRVLSELVISDLGWFAALAEHPMPCLRRLVVEAETTLDGLAAAVAALPQLEELVVFGPAVLELPHLQSSTLRRISLGMGSIDDDEIPPGWSARLAAALARSELPALRSAAIDASGVVYLD